MTEEKVIVLFIWQVREELAKFLSDGLGETDNVILLFPEDTSEEALLELAPQAHVVVGWRPSSEFLDRAQNLSLFINPGAGVQHHIDTFRELDQHRKIDLVNGHGNSYFTAQHAVTLLLALTNKVIPHHNWMKEGEWRRGDEHASSIPLRARNVGLLGYGSVNSKVHQFLSSFDVKFHVLKRDWSDFEEKPVTELKKYTPAQLTEFFEAINTVIIAVPQTEDTIGLIGMKELELLGRDGLLVNMARGIVIDQESLYSALRDNIIAGAAIDVWYDYRPEPDAEGRKYPFQFPFHELDNVVLSPHRAASPFNDLERWQEVIENIKRRAAGRSDFLNLVNLERGY